MKKFLLFFFTLLQFANLSAQIPRETRAVWVSTNYKLDWPPPTFDEQTQKEALIKIFDNIEKKNLNTIYLQVRSNGTVLFKSSYDPFSPYITGTADKMGSYDPLKFAIEEAHKRGMELHAWFNPYRAVRSIGNYIQASNHVTQQHPEWILTFNQINIKILNPGLLEVREYVKNIVMDVVTRYDVDGVHFDDYFYPYPNSDKGFNGITNEDASTFNSYPRGFSNIGDWRRDNVNELISIVYNAIHS
jgi:uncharacterized lipoprotein YddW (UPF0748 family)